MNCGHVQFWQQDSNLQALSQNKENAGSAMEFQEMTITRKAEIREKTEKSRREVVERLHILRMRNGKEDKIKICGIPNEMWSEILSRVKNLKDLGNMWEAHSRFRPLSRKSPVLVEYLLIQLLTIETLPYLWEDNKTRLSKLKMFRTFSRGMRAAVDSLIEENLMKALRSDRPQAIVSFRLKFSPILFAMGFLRGVLQITRRLGNRVFHRSFSMTLSNPLVIAKGIFNRGPSRDLHFAEYQRIIISLLEIIGDQIWYFQVNIAVTGEHPFLQQCISLMPNLKWLTLEITTPKIKMDLDNFQFPHLDHLERITFGGSHPSHAFAASVIRPNLHIKILEFVGFNMAENDLFFMEMTPLLAMLDNLSAFYGNSDWNASRMEILQPVVCSKWKLKSISLKSESLQLGGLIKFANNIPTLEHLSLHPLKIILGDEILPPLSLPHLTQFNMNLDIRSIDYSSVENVIFFTSLQFLIECKKLQDLRWSFSWFDSTDWVWERERKRAFFKDFMRRHEAIEKIQFKCGYQEDLGNSNLWDVFPRLEYVKASVPCGGGCQGKIREVRKSKLLSIK